MDCKLEEVPLPITDADRAKAFYVDQVGFNADHDHGRREPAVRAAHAARLRVLDHLRRGDQRVRPGSVKGLMLVVDDIRRAHSELSGRGVDVSEIHELPWGDFVYFSDPDGNSWSIQDMTRIRAQQ